jgi:hypothetical protein
MNALFRSLALFGFAALVTSCGSTPTKTFDVKAINFDGNSVPCLVVVDRDFKEAIEAKRYTDCEVKLEFEKERVNLKLYPTRYDAQGKVVPPDPAATGAYYAEMRELQLTDPRQHLFVLRTNPDYVGG